MLLPSSAGGLCGGPRAFAVPAGEEVSAPMLHAQTQAQRALAAMEAARAEATAVGRTGAAYADACAARVQATRARLQHTSCSAAASARLEASRALHAANSLQAAVRSGQPLALAAAPSYFSGAVRSGQPLALAAAPSYFSGDHFVESDAQDESLMHAPPRGSSSSGLRLSTRGSSRQEWNRSPAKGGERPAAATFDEGPLSPAQLGLPRRDNIWSRRVEQRRRAADGGGAALALEHEQEMAAYAASPAASQFSQTNPHDPFPSPSNLSASPRPASSVVASVGDASSADDFASSLRSYTQQWWVRLHNSDNKVNSSPYYVGNQSAYYPNRGDANNEQASGASARKQTDQPHTAREMGSGRLATHSSAAGWHTARAKHEESKEALQLPQIPPARAAPHSARGSSAGSAMPLKKLVTSSALNPPVSASAVPSSAPPSALRSLLSSAPASSSHASAAAALTASSPRVRGSSHHGSRFGSAAQRQRLLTQNVCVKTLAASEAGNLNPSWAQQPHLLSWKRRPDTMTLVDPPPPLALVSVVPSDRDASAAASARSGARRGPRFQYDAVSELHGFLSQKDIRGLLRATNYTRRELFVLFVRFKALCALSPSPHGIDKHTFKKGVARLAVEDDRFVNRVFSLVDDDSSGHIEWEEFLTAMSALEKGDPEAKARFFFQVYDLDADGFISRADLGTMFHSSSMLSDDATTVEVVRTFVERVFASFGATESGRISFEDVLRYMQQHGDKEDVWDVFGRSMLQDFNARPGH